MADKIIFLDIDGVVCSIRSAIAFGGYPHRVRAKDIKLFDQVAIALIRRVCKERGAKIVLSSTWRFTVRYKSLAKKLDLPIIDSTAMHRREKRGDEIKQWLDKYPEVKVYAIVDDDDDMLDEQVPFFVKVDSQNGLSYKNYLGLNTILGWEVGEDGKKV